MLKSKAVVVARPMDVSKAQGKLTYAKVSCVLTVVFQQALPERVGVRLRG